MNGFNRFVANLKNDGTSLKCHITQNIHIKTSHVITSNIIFNESIVYGVQYPPDNYDIFVNLLRQ
jgi:hypothetical protein